MNQRNFVGEEGHYFRECSTWEGQNIDLYAPWLAGAAR
jgi:hypothetical protein